MLKILYGVEPDEFKGSNGMELAELMIRDAAGLLLPYVASCPACLDSIFSVIANDVLADVHTDLKAGKNPSVFYVLGPEGEARQAAFREHIEGNRETVVALLANSEDAHHH